MRRLRLGPLGVVLATSALAAALAPAMARAGDMTHPRTPVEWPEDTPCMTVVDRSQQPVLHFPYTIPYEDLELTPHEYPESRQHQFLALCRNYSPQEPLPTYISEQDVADYSAWLVSEGFPPVDVMPDDVLDTHSVYADCVHRITPDDPRRPISFAEAAKGVDWDTTDLPAGAYIVHGYNWEPSINVWYKRPGVVHVVDGPDLAAVGPAAALTNLEDYLELDETLTLQGCARAMPGSTVTGYWSLTGPEGLDWIPFAEDVPLDGESLSLAFTPPPEAIGEIVALRVDVTDPMQRTFSAFPVNLVVVLKDPIGGSTTGDCGDSGNFIQNESCGDTEDATGSGGTGGGVTTGTGGGTVTGGGSGGVTAGASGVSTGSTGSATGTPVTGMPKTCGCQAGGSGQSWAWSGLALLALGRRRARRRDTL